MCWCKKAAYLAGAEKSPQRSELGLGWTTVLELLLSSSSKQPAKIDKQCKLQVEFQWISCSQKLSELCGLISANNKDLYKELYIQCIYLYKYIIYTLIHFYKNISALNQGSFCIDWYRWYRWRDGTFFFTSYPNKHLKSVYTTNAMCWHCIIPYYIQGLCRAPHDNNNSTSISSSSIICR